jgi:hypothetical protein
MKKSIATAALLFTLVSAQTTIKTVVPQWLIVVNEGGDGAWAQRDNGLISYVGNNNTFDTYVSFTMPSLRSLPGATASSLCRLVVSTPELALGNRSATVAQLLEPIKTAVGVPFPHLKSQRLGALFFFETPVSQYVGDDGSSAFPCAFGTDMQFALTPYFLGVKDITTIEWYQTAATGVFIEVIGTVPSPSMSASMSRSLPSSSVRSMSMPTPSQ